MRIASNLMIVVSILIHASASASALSRGSQRSTEVDRAINAWRMDNREPVETLLKRKPLRGIEALGKIGDDASEARLIAILQGRDPSLGFAAASALAQRPSDRAETALFSTLVNPATEFPVRFGIATGVMGAGIDSRRRSLVRTFLRSRGNVASVCAFAIYYTPEFPVARNVTVRVHQVLKTDWERELAQADAGDSARAAYLSRELHKLYLVTGDTTRATILQLRMDRERVTVGR